MHRGPIETVYPGNDAGSGFRLCEQALAIDPNNVRALNLSALEFLPSFFWAVALAWSDASSAG